MKVLSENIWKEARQLVPPPWLTESVIMTAIIDAKQSCNVMMMADTTNAFVQVEIDKKEEGKRIIMKIRGLLVNMLIELSPETSENCVVDEGNSKLLFVRMIEHYMACYSHHCQMTRNFRRILSQLDSKSILMIYELQIALLIANSTQ